jgi:hypothetical protein
MITHEFPSAVAYFPRVCLHQLVLLSNRGILQPVHACVAEIWVVHDRRGGFGNHYRMCPWLLNPYLTRRTGASDCQNPRFRLLCFHRLAERDGVV